MMEEPTNHDFTREYKFHDPPMTIRVHPRSCFFCDHCTDIFYDWNGPYGWACEKHQCSEDGEGPTEKGLLGRCQDFIETEESSEDDKHQPEPYEEIPIELKEALKETLFPIIDDIILYGAQGVKTMMMYPEYFMSPIEIPIKPEPNLITGEGHGHYRSSTREKVPKNYYKHKHAKTKMANQSRKRNRV